MWERKQLMRVGCYRRFAALDDKEYRDLLERTISCHAGLVKDHLRMETKCAAKNPEEAK